MSILRDNGQSVEFVLPDNVIRLTERNSRTGGNQFFHGRHERFHTVRGIHAADAVITACNQSKQFSGTAAVVRDRHGGITRPRFKLQHIGQCIRYTQIGRADHKSRFGIFDTANHLCLFLHGL